LVEAQRRKEFDSPPWGQKSKSFSTNFGKVVSMGTTSLENYGVLKLCRFESCPFRQILIVYF